MRWYGGDALRTGVLRYIQRIWSVFYGEHSAYGKNMFWQSWYVFGLGSHYERGFRGSSLHERREWKSVYVKEWHRGPLRARGGHRGHSGERKPCGLSVGQSRHGEQSVQKGSSL